MDVIEIDGYPLHPTNIRAEALLLSAKTPEDNEIKTLRVCAILFHLTSRQYASAGQWKFLPNELVLYLIENSLFIKKDLFDFTYNSWNMFGLPVGWQIIKGRRTNSIKNLSILIDANCREKDISHYEIFNRGLLIRAVSIRYIDGTIITGRICDMFVPGALTLTIIFSIWEQEHDYRTTTKRARKIIADSRSHKYFTYELLHDFYFDSFPKLEENYQLLRGYTKSEADADFEKIQKNFELCQQLLR
jgi:hypothetical protein